ncbi:anthranilate phosphoribosyltransferase [Oleisolibacter albus]|uniref:anthranilate phosphoribosyltransferase n=1 Tax=Oleisolibacter albus TaxID=2171757 RepID=UPI001EFC8F7D|nr:anthranilate phosphoribosyltransferase [Oleisolibacter albus]
MSSTADMGTFKGLLSKVAGGASLSEDEARTAFDIIMSGNATPAQMGGFLMALRVRGETVDEITGAARTMRAKAIRIQAPAGTIDTCGTGGDSAGTYNISTAVAFVVAGCGVPVAKHGNRAVSSKSGAADVLGALGLNLDADFPRIEQALREANIAFLMAPRHHMAMRNVGPTRVELGTRTIFNLMGPLLNPAGAKRQLMGVFDRRWTGPIAQVLGRLGSERAWVVHGSDGLDEITTTGPTFVSELRDGAVRDFEITPEAVGLTRVGLDDLRGGDPQANAEALRAVLGGARGPYRDIVLLNAAAALVVAGAVDDLPAGLARAALSIDQGAAARALDRLVQLTSATEAA